MARIKFPIEASSSHHVDLINVDVLLSGASTLLDAAVAPNLPSRSLELLKGRVYEVDGGFVWHYDDQLFVDACSDAEHG